MHKATEFRLEARPQLPEALHRLGELANDLFYSWNHGVRGLFARIDLRLWQKVEHNPKLFLRRVSQHRLEEAAADRAFLAEYRRVLSSYDAYVEAGPGAEVVELLNPETSLVAYFCAEFGFHESFPIYSGGLGILAGDHCKAASDLGLPFVAVGLLYQQGYFMQTIDAQGQQVARYQCHDSDELPISPVEQDGVQLKVSVPFPGRELWARVWQARVGHIRLYLLDANTPENNEQDRELTLQLYGGDSDTRISQEILLGIGGTRALAALGIKPAAWHIIYRNRGAGFRPGFRAGQQERRWHLQHDQPGLAGLAVPQRCQPYPRRGRLRNGRQHLAANSSGRKPHRLHYQRRACFYLSGAGMGQPV